MQLQSVSKMQAPAIALADHVFAEGHEVVPCIAHEWRVKSFGMRGNHPFCDICQSQMIHLIFPEGMNIAFLHKRMLAWC